MQYDKKLHDMYIGCRAMRHDLQNEEENLRQRYLMLQKQIITAPEHMKPNLEGYCKDVSKELGLLAVDIKQVNGLVSRIAHKLIEQDKRSS